MCGIAGIVEWGVSPGVDEPTVERMAAAMLHRGPDDGGVWLSPDRRVGLGFRRLAIIDLTATGHQPMVGEQGNVLVYNGEIYNHADERARLEAGGVRYRGRSDSETLLNLYDELGEACLPRLRGMFAFAVWDARRRRLLLARDRLGVKPLYYTARGGRFAFASEIKALLTLPWVARELDHEALQHYLTFVVTPAPSTLFAGIHKLPAASLLTLSSDGELKIERWWDAIVPTVHGRSPGEWAERTRALMDESIRLRMMSDVPYGVFLSGGIDSLTNVALMARHTSAPINTFSVGFKDHTAYNELEPARLVAEHFGTRHHEVLIDHEDALAYLPRLVESQDEPISDWVCVPLYFVARRAREAGVIVVHVGEGADELFCGYPHFLGALAWNQLFGWLGAVPRGLWRPAARALDGTRLGRLFDGLADGGRSFWGGATVFRGQSKRRILETPFWRGRRVDSGLLPEAILAAYDAAKPDADEVQRMTYLELQHRLPEMLLMRVDKITMSASVEGREPYLDHVLVEHAMSMPQQLKIQGGRTKAVMKRAVEGLLPDSVIRRPKMGFTAPVAEWFRGGLAADLRRTLTGGTFVREGWLNGAYVEELLGEHAARRANHAIILWNLYNLELWHRRWLS